MINYYAEEDILNTGLYNLGFIAINNNRNGKNLMDWWADRLYHKAYINFSKGSVHGSNLDEFRTFIF